VLLVLIAACTTEAPSQPPPPIAPAPVLPDLDPTGPGELRVRLAFGTAADLDLYVTDPLQEAVYFGNNPSLGGGQLDVDRRCEHPAPRVESIVFARPQPGRYRVSIDYARACSEPATPVAYRVRVEAPGVDREHRGEIKPGFRELISLEFELEDVAG
jgi:hypothetical protein